MDNLLELLQPEDRLSIVSFNSSATRDTKLLRMSEKGKKTIRNKMKQLRPDGTTNIGSGISLALK